MPSSFFKPKDRPLLHLGLFILTILSTFSAYWIGLRSGAPSWAEVEGALTFSLSLVFILGAHEMGHYALARLHGVDTSLPYFIPLPLLGVGTLGAVIRIRDRIPNRNALVDIGAAGPLAGLVAAVPLLSYGLSHSHFGAAKVPSDTWPGSASLWNIGVQLVQKAGERLGYLPHRALPPIFGSGEATFFGNNLLLVGLRRLIMGPIPEGMDVMAHPAVLAAWFGTLVTMLNLIPIGQLDGGHLTYALFGERARTVGKVMGAGILGLCLFASVGWLLWLIITTQVIGFKHPEVVEPRAPVTGARRWVCALCLLGLALCVMPIPISSA